MSLPCFDGTALWVKLTEKDEMNDDQALVALDCSNLQLGNNSINIEISEDTPSELITVANVFDSAFGFSFGFGTSSGQSQEPATYQMNIFVAEQCHLDTFDATAVHAETGITFH